MRERDNMGPVNLRAEVEAQEITDKMTSMTTERDDLVAAIGKLREGINTLNKEARTRLLAAFDIVNTHFQKLFTRLFNGGQAYLKLIEAEDPLEFGPRNLCPASRQEKLRAVPALGRRTDADLHRPYLRDVPDQPRAHLRAGRS